MFDLGRIEDAINDYTKAINNNPQNASAYKHRGRYYFKSILGLALNQFGRKEDAINDYTKSIEIDPQ